MVLRSTARATCDTEVNSGSRASGIASIAVSTRVAAPTIHSAHRNSLSGNQTIHFNMIFLLKSECIEYSISQSPQARLAKECKNPYLGRRTPKSRIDARSGKPDQRAGIHGLRTVLRAAADGGGCLWPCPGARRNFRFSRAAFIRALLFRAQGRERQDRGGDLEIRPRTDAVQAAGGT